MCIQPSTRRGGFETLCLRLLQKALVEKWNRAIQLS